MPVDIWTKNRCTAYVHYATSTERIGINVHWTYMECVTFVKLKWQFEQVRNVEVNSEQCQLVNFYDSVLHYPLSSILKFLFFASIFSKGQRSASMHVDCWGHMSLKEYLHKLGLYKRDLNCEQCGRRTLHVLCECAALDRKRQQFDTIQVRKLQKLVQDTRLREWMP